MFLPNETLNALSYKQDKIDNDFFLNACDYNVCKNFEKKKKGKENKFIFKMKIILHIKKLKILTK